MENRRRRQKSLEAEKNKHQSKVGYEGLTAQRLLLAKVFQFDWHLVREFKSASQADTVHQCLLRIWIRPEYPPSSRDRIVLVHKIEPLWLYGLEIATWLMGGIGWSGSCSSISRARATIDLVNDTGQGESDAWDGEWQSRWGRWGGRTIVSKYTADFDSYLHLRIMVWEGESSTEDSLINGAYASSLLVVCLFLPPLGAIANSTGHDLPPLISTIVLQDRGLTTHFIVYFRLTKYDLTLSEYKLLSRRALNRGNLIICEEEEESNLQYTFIESAASRRQYALRP